MYTGNPNPVIWPLHCNIYILLNRSLNPCWQTPSFISFDKRKLGVIETICDVVIVMEESEKKTTDIYYKH